MSSKSVLQECQVRRVSYKSVTSVCHVRVSHKRIRWKMWQISTSIVSVLQHTCRHSGSWASSCCIFRNHYIIRKQYTDSSNWNVVIRHQLFTILRLVFKSYDPSLWVVFCAWLSSQDLQAEILLAYQSQSIRRFPSSSSTGRQQLDVIASWMIIVFVLDGFGDLKSFLDPQLKVSYCCFGVTT